MKTVKATIVTVDLQCSNCGLGITDAASGSFCHIAEELGRTITCKQCTAVMKVPVWVLTHA